MGTARIGNLIVLVGWIAAFSAGKLMPGPCAGIQHIWAWLRSLEGLGDKSQGPCRRRDQWLGALFLNSQRSALPF